jgi:signal transduction histidine kinase
VQNESQSEFFRAAAHQLKSPIAIIQWCLQSALESKEVKGKDREMVLKAVRQADSMGQLIGELSHLFRLSDRSVPLTLTRVDLASLAEKAVSQCSMAAERAGVRLRAGQLETGLSVLADEMLARQSVVNLVDNAIKYSDRDGSVEVTLVSRKGRALLAVRDHGIGIAPAEMEQVFVEFYRGAQARAHAPEGSGLGLALAQRIAQEFGGSIALESSLGKGSVFTLSLPIAG